MKEKQAQKGFWPPSVMKDTFKTLDIFGYFLEFSGNFFGNFLGGFFVGIFWEEFFGRNFLGGFF